MHRILIQKNSYGRTYGEHREFLEFNIEQHRMLKKYAEEEMGVTYFSSVWDMTSLKEMISLEPKIIKFPSAMSTNWQMHEYICTHFNGEIHISSGMTAKNELKKSFSFMRNTKGIKM